MPVTKGPGKRDTVVVTIHRDTEYGPVDDRGIKDGDHRDPDYVLDLTDCNVHPLDNTPSGSAAEPDWSQGWICQDSRGRILAQQPAGDCGTPPEPYLTCWKRGLRFVHPVVAQDFQQHG